MPTAIEPKPGSSKGKRSLPPAIPLTVREEESGILQPQEKYYDPVAQRISDSIDEGLKKESQARKEAKKRTVKVMLLGQAESGKSTLQKQFQLYYASKTLEHERPTWRPVVYFNVVKAIRMILDELDYQLSLTPPQSATSLDDIPEDRYQEEISELRTKLLPLVALEHSLASELSGGISLSRGQTGVFVRAGWQGLGRSKQIEDVGKPQVVTNMTARTLASLQDDICALWAHPAVKSQLAGNKLRLEESAPFFLDNIRRLSAPDYLPTTDDILNVRLQTLGVIEHSFPINLSGLNYLWKLYDVGGARGQRQTWVPYFDDATAIIFLAPISAFDQYLDESPKTNRIDDSLQLFTSICSSDLLRKAHLVLLLNKTDLLKKKLAAGRKVRRFITSYGDRPNTYEAVSSYFRAHFVQVHQRKDTSKRTLFVHFTSMLDIQATQSIISNVGEAIIRQHIQQTGLA